MRRPVVRPECITVSGSRIAMEGDVRVASVAGGVRWDMALSHSEREPVRCERVEIFPDQVATDRVQVFRQGFYMPSDPCGFAELRAGAPVPRASQWQPDWLSESQFLSHSMIVIRSPRSKRLTLLGFIESRRFQGLFIVDTAGPRLRLSAVVETEGISLKPSESLAVEAFVILEGDDFNELLARYADIVAERNGARVPAQTVTGWSDWQYYRQEKTEADVLRSLPALQRLRDEGCPLRYVQVDGGYCRHNSEWFEVGEKFPSGMPALSRRIREAGLEFGIWLAPWIVNVETRVAGEHPEWLVRDALSGEPLTKAASNVGRCCMLDFSIPEALEWLRGVVRTMVREWRIGYLKLDGPCLAHWRGGVFHDSQATTVSVTRDSLRVIREECGDDVIVEGEGVYLPSVGFVDVQRTTQDNWTHWYDPDTGAPATKRNMQHDLMTGFLHGRWWGNHRENVILRDFLSPHHHRTARDPALKDVLIPENEKRLQVTVGAMVGGAMLLTEPMDRMLRDPDARRWIARFLPHAEGAHCFPLDPFPEDGVAPSIWAVRIERPFETWWNVAVFNWGDGYRDRVVPLASLDCGGAVHAFEFWRQEYLGRFREEMAVANVPPHGCRVFALHRARRAPQPIGTNIHVLQGATEIEDWAFEKDTLRVQLRHWIGEDLRVTIKHPKTGAIADVQTNAPDRLIDTRQPGLATVHLNARRGSRRTELRIRYTKR